MNRLILALLFTICASSIFAMDIEGDKELLSTDVVRYFKEVSEETGKPISLRITLNDRYSDRETLEDQKTLPLDFSPKPISKSFIVSTSKIFKDLLTKVSEGKEAGRLSLDVTIWVDDPDHKEKANGFYILRKEE